MAVVAVRLLGASSVRWVFGGTQGASGVLTVTTCSNMSAHMSVTVNHIAILITMRYFYPFFYYSSLRTLGAHLFAM